MSPDVALNQIVSDWAKGDKIEPLKATEDPFGLREIIIALDVANIKLNDIYGWVADIKGYYDE